MSYAYIERYYGTKFEPGMRVLFLEYKYRLAGTVQRARGDPQYVRVLFDNGDVGNCHPKSLAICMHCLNETEPGWVEQDNNGPIVPCQVCNPDGAFERTPTAREAG